MPKLVYNTRGSRESLMALSICLRNSGCCDRWFLQFMCEKLKIKSTKEADKLKAAKEEVYLLGFYQGVLEVKSIYLQ